MTSAWTLAGLRGAPLKLPRPLRRSIISLSSHASSLLQTRRFYSGLWGREQSSCGLVQESKRRRFRRLLGQRGRIRRHPHSFHSNSKRCKGVFHSSWASSTRSAGSSPHANTFRCSDVQGGLLTTFSSGMFPAIDFRIVLRIKTHRMRMSLAHSPHRIATFLVPCLSRYAKNPVFNIVSTEPSPSTILSTGEVPDHYH